MFHSGNLQNTRTDQPTAFYIRFLTRNYTLNKIDYVISQKKIMNLNFSNKNIHYQKEGSGQTIVLLHGFLECLDIWKYFTKKLSDEFKVISIDLPGFGLSDNFSETHTMEFMADAVKAVLDYEKIKTCVIAGHSMGGYVTLAFAEKYPKVLNGFCLFNSQAAADSEEAKINRDRVIKRIQKNSIDFINEFIPDLFAESNKAIFTDQIKELKIDASKTSKEGIIAALLGMKERPDSLSLLRSFDKPILFITGKQDKRIPPETIIKQATLPYHSEFLLHKNVGHMGFIEERDLTLRVLKDFTQRCFEEINYQ